MNTQRHQIRRQIIEFTVPNRETGLRLHDELPRIQRNGIEALIDRCCTELSPPDRVHRLGRVEVNLELLSLDNLEKELLQKLYPVLREALVQHIREDEALTAMLGEDPATNARLELVSLFARTGTLPFWADVARPRVVDETVQALLERNASALARLVRGLSRDTRALKRLVRQVSPERLQALFEVLVDAPGSMRAARAAEVWDLLVIAQATSVSPPMIWIAVLQTVCHGENREGREPVAFFREVLGRIALETRKTYRELVARLYGEVRPRRGEAARGFVRVLGELAEEVGAKVFGGKVPGTFDESGAEHIQKVPTTFGKSDVEHTQKVPTTLVNAQPSSGFSSVGGTPNSPAPVGPPLRSPPPALEKHGRSPQFLEEARVQKVPTTLDMSEEGHSPKVPTTLGTSDSTHISKVPTTLDTSEPQHTREVPTIFDISAATHASKVPTTLDNGALTHAPQVPTTFEMSGPSHNPKVPTTFESAPAPRESRSETEFFGVGGGAPLFEPAKRASLGGTTSAEKPGSDRGFPPAEKVPAEKVPTTCSSAPAPRESRSETEFFGAGGGAPLFEPAKRASLGGTTSAEKPGSGRDLPPSRAPSRTAPSRTAPSQARKPNLHEDPAEVYLDTAGLVLLWPFLATFFDRLDLLREDHTFRHPAARCRGVYLLHYLATSDIEPPEYRLPLPKILCGMPLEDLFDPNPELTPTEITECADLLTATIAHAKNLGDLSPQDFRDTFLIRRGVISTRDDSWLLRVERAPYDLALDKLPWPITWIRLPWMTAPLAVEWLR